MKLKRGAGTLRAREYRRRQSWDEQAFFEDEEEPKSAVAEYMPIVLGGLMLVAAFAFAGNYVGRNASAHTAVAAAVEFPAVPQTTSLASKSSLLAADDTMSTVAVKSLRRQSVLLEGKGDLFLPDAGAAQPVPEPNTKSVAEAEPQKRIKIVPAAVDLKAENDVATPVVKKLASNVKTATADDSLKIGKADKKQALLQRRLQQAELNCLARAVYFEARSESEMGQMAVAKVIINRTHDPAYPKTICGVVYQGSQNRNSCQFSFACDGQPDDVKSPAAWAQSRRVATMAMTGGLKMGSAMDQATNYHANYVKPRWARQMRRLVKIGNHIFYSNG
ncbi:MAG: cell wall hydrolase [Hyphomicrobiales bacterium]